MACCRTDPQSLILAATAAVAVLASAWSAPASFEPGVLEAGPVAGPSIAINEVQYDPATDQRENGYEWLELFNVGAGTVDLTGWRIADNVSSDELPAVDLASGEMLVVAAGDGFRNLFPGFVGRLVVLGGSVGNGLGNTGDRLMLLDRDGVVIDAMSYGSDATALDPPVGLVESGHSLERMPAGADTDTAADWRDQQRPSPGEPAAGVRSTSTSEPTPGPVPPGEAAVLNEFLPSPRDVDWDGDGTASALDEWIELYNPGRTDLHLRGWQLDDTAEGGSDPWFLPDGLVLPAGGHLAIFRKDSGVALNNDGDAVRLLSPDGQVADQTVFSSSAADRSIARDGDGVGPWTDALSPSPGRANRNPPPEAGTPSTIEPTAGGPGDTPTAPPQPTPSAVGTAAPANDAWLPYLLSEVHFDPVEAGLDSAHEWVEIHNRGAYTASLAGWRIGDGAEWDELPDAWVPPQGFLVVTADRSLRLRLAETGVLAVAIGDGRIGNGLGNGGDVVRLRGPTGAVDAVGYGSNLDAFDPSVPIGRAGWSIERIPPAVDTDSAADWWPQPDPSPGRAGSRTVGPPRVFLNEILPAPRAVDWDGSGTADHTDEWVELVNRSSGTADLGGWRLENDGAGHGWSHRLPEGTRLGPGAYLVLYRQTSGLALVNGGDAVRLRRDDGLLADEHAWPTSPGYDRSWSRTADGVGAWTGDYAVTPGEPNRPAEAKPGAPERGPRPTDPPRVARVVEARRLARRSRVRLAGRITAPPGAFGPREAYLQDETGGIKLYLADADASFGQAADGCAVIATGSLEDYHGERELVLDAAADLWVDPSVAAQPIPPRPVATGELGDDVEGLLVRLAGRVVGRRGVEWVLDDGTGPARVVLRPATGLRLPRVALGTWAAAVGIAGQYARSAPWTDGHRLMPRGAGDLDPAGRRAPARLPSTGLGGSPGLTVRLGFYTMPGP